jgi:hypothetical protein
MKPFKLTPRRWPDFILRMPALAISHYRFLRAATPWGPSTISRRQALRASLLMTIGALRIHWILMTAEHNGGERGIAPWTMKRVRERISHDLSRLPR